MAKTTSSFQFIKLSYISVLRAINVILSENGVVLTGTRKIRKRDISKPLFYLDVRTTKNPILRNDPQ
jgi:hypothetical protein